MTRFGYTLMTEQSGPRELVSYAVAAEQTGFDFEVMSDHYSPWLTEQGTRRTPGRPWAPSRRPPSAWA
jgi:alkanesulfonate monooxygenase SsuD/methylene tetrahydromethanopterin reductase-like flavin-dependent oxidoreductase (luciferase family)